MGVRKRRPEEKWLFAAVAQEINGSSLLLPTAVWGHNIGNIVWIRTKFTALHYNNSNLGLELDSYKVPVG